MERWLVWIADQHPQGWGCSQYEWSFSIPALLIETEARNAHDRLASASFEEHDCVKYAQREDEPHFGVAYPRSVEKRF